MIVALRSEALIRRLETEKLKFMIAKLRREQFGQSSERGRLLVEQLKLAIADVDDPPPLKWSALRYGFRALEDGRNG